MDLWESLLQEHVGFVFYKSMLGLWLGFGSLVALSQIVLLRKELTKSASIELSLQRQKDELAEIAILDPLTQLFNRRGLKKLHQDRR